MVNIEAVADPTPPTFTEEDLLHDVRGEISRLVEQIADISAQEAMDQVYRRVTIFLCTACYMHWIEKPAA